MLEVFEVGIVRIVEKGSHPIFKPKRLVLLSSGTTHIRDLRSSGSAQLSEILSRRVLDCLGEYCIESVLPNKMPVRESVQEKERAF